MFCEKIKLYGQIVHKYNPSLPNCYNSQVSFAIMHLFLFKFMSPYNLKTKLKLLPPLYIYIYIYIRAIFSFDYLPS